ncbi:hypothetical protein PV328_006265 [Microctonus aethiopoides]|uniref:Uncharacterized protein n=1 Tax=Microctonus aethiopoides TaxID=144406 RepID=A0AA39FNR3_9HYME|nr:hypothetical protein PV328_006265 [Microctonus aethiopoides]
MEFFRAPPTSGNIFTKIKAYHAKHPIVFAQLIMTAISLSYSCYKFSTMDYDMMLISKYKRDYIVLRPDDPKVNMIKRGPIGLDY